MTLRRMYKAPDVPVGHILNPRRGFFSVIIPIQRTNLVTNPSLETNTTGYSASGGGVLSRASGTSAYGPPASYHGAYSLSTTPAISSGGLFYLTSTLASGTVYAASCKFLGTPGVRYKLSIATTGGVDLAAYSFVASGRWQWVWVYYKESSSTARRIYVTGDSDARATVGLIYVDGVQLEAINAGETVSTYIDGDQAGLLPNQSPAPYYWSGTPHASTSTRLASTRAGGYVMNFDRFRYRVLAYAGLGLTTIANIAAIPAAADGASYQATIARPRQFVVNGYFDAPSLGTLQRAQSDMYDALGPDSAVPRQPCVLLYQACDGERPIGKEGRIVASYQAGLEGNQDSPFRENAPLTFSAYLPAIQAGESGAALTVQTSVGNANAILQRAPDGTWSAMGTGASTGASKVVRAIVVAPDGSVYAGGDFDTMGGVANTSKIAKWTPSTSAWTALGTGITGGSVFALAVGPDGTLYAGGNFTTSGGVATANISKWNGSAWSTVGTSGDINSEVDALAVDPTGNLYVGGGFTNAGGIAAADFIAKWSGSAWSALGATPLGNGVRALAVGLDGKIYVGGDFLDAGGIAAADELAYWNGAWNAMSTGVNNEVNALAVGRTGIVYVGGIFTTAGGVGAAYIAAWNGTGFAALGSGIDNRIRAIAPLPDGTLYAGGDLTTAGGITLPDSLARWNGSAWIAADVDLPGAPQVGALAYAAPTGYLYVGFSTTGTATASGVTIVTNPGTARTYPTLIMQGPSSGTARIYQLLNATNGKLLYLNLTMNAGETVTIRMSPGGASAVSSFRGDAASAILPGSSSDFALEKGANSISFFSAGSSVTATIVFPVCYQSPADLTE